MSDFIEVAANQGTDISEVANELQILADLAPTFHVCIAPNSIPVVRSIRIEITTDTSLDERWFDDQREFSPWLKALEDLRRKTTREAGAISMSRPSSSPSINMPRQPRETASIS